MPRGSASSRAAAASWPRRRVVHERLVGSRGRDADRGVSTGTPCGRRSSEGAAVHGARAAGGRSRAMRKQRESIQTEIQRVSTERRTSSARARRGRDGPRQCHAPGDPRAAMAKGFKCDGVETRTERPAWRRRRSSSLRRRGDPARAVRRPGLRRLCSGGVRPGDEAVDRALASSPDLLLLDVLLPGKDGFEILRELRASIRSSRYPADGARRRGGSRARPEARRRRLRGQPFSASELLAASRPCSAARPSARGCAPCVWATAPSTWSWARSHSRAGRSAACPSWNPASCAIWRPIGAPCRSPRAAAARVGREHRGDGDAHDRHARPAPAREAGARPGTAQAPPHGTQSRLHALRSGRQEAREPGRALWLVFGRAISSWLRRSSGPAPSSLRWSARAAGPGETDYQDRYGWRCGAWTPGCRCFSLARPHRRRPSWTPSSCCCTSRSTRECRDLTADPARRRRAAVFEGFMPHLPPEAIRATVARADSRWARSWGARSEPTATRRGSSPQIKSKKTSSTPASLARCRGRPVRPRPGARSLPGSTRRAFRGSRRWPSCVAWKPAARSGSRGSSSTGRGCASGCCSRSATCSPPRTWSAQPRPLRRPTRWDTGWPTSRSCCARRPRPPSQPRDHRRRGGAGSGLARGDRAMVAVGATRHKSIDPASDGAGSSPRLRTSCAPADDVPDVLRDARRRRRPDRGATPRLPADVEGRVAALSAMVANVLAHARLEERRGPRHVESLSLESLTSACGRRSNGARILRV